MLYPQPCGQLLRIDIKLSYIKVFEATISSESYVPLQSIQLILARSPCLLIISKSHTSWFLLNGVLEPRMHAIADCTMSNDSRVRIQVMV